MEINSSTGDGAEDDVGFFAFGDFFGERSVGGLVGEIFLAGEEADQGTALFGGLVADGAAEHGIFVFEGVQDRALGDRRGNIQLDLAIDAGEVAEMMGEDDADHNGSYAPTGAEFLSSSKTHGLRTNCAMGLILYWRRG